MTQRAHSDPTAITRDATAITNSPGPPSTSTGNPSLALTLRSLPPSVLFAAALVLVLLWAFGPSLAGLWDRWLNDSRYNHGYFVPLFSLYLIYRQRRHLATIQSGSPWGVLLVLAGLGMRAVGVFIYLDWLATFALLPCLAGIVVLVVGWKGLKRTWPAIAFLTFMIPLPFQLETALSQPLQRVATIISTATLRLMGLPTFSEGNTIRLGEIRIGVVEACSGLSMLVIFFALCTAVAMLVDRPLWERLLVALMAVPLALISNIARIVVTAVLHWVAGSYLANLVFHDLAGWLMMPLALGLLWLCARLFSWVFPIRAKGPDARVLVHGLTPAIPGVPGIPGIPGVPGVKGRS
jgi:exosortase